MRERATLHLTRLLRSGPEWKFTASAGLELDDFRIDSNDERLRDEQLRVVELGGKLIWRSDAMTQYLLSMDVRKGLTAFGAGLQAQDLADDPRREDFLLLRLQLVRYAKFNELWSLRTDMLGQYTGYVLPYNERFKIGGDRLGRGYEVAEIAGDRGIGAKLELRRGLVGLQSPIGKPSVYGFYDFGAAWKQDATDRESATTAGVGIALEGQRATGYVELAQPLTHPDVEGNSDITLFTAISLRF